ncbi:protein CHAPERONE-LIKE PROTEIN OF POR1 [Cucumis melo var. makuwa]|uniref:Protein CHAPERONE-LIKE PROTEIN OF POR1 n=1 Tax=Cucumis melo var. makuwa TaxID=1194695 RepID=A0A5D3D731_CUCMM|nr:protein CHAPERONE-LIKE PROTEIN OF POR1 [Cucumis melo var. makuwa]TYK19369.1 protein CHAPERONE-LIKE PROTEIN OF POR1 [Cucumis melo var. makuwa]
MAATLSVRPNPLSGGAAFPTLPAHRLVSTFLGKFTPLKGVSISQVFQTPAMTATLVQAGSRADDSTPFEMSVDNALKVLGVSDAASFDDILRARNSILADCKDEEETVAQIEAAYDMLLMRSLTQRRAGKVVSSRILYADVKHIKESKTRLMPQWLQSTRKNTQLSIETPTISDFGIQAVVYGALMVLTYVNGAATSTMMKYDGADVPGLILASSFGASLYFMTKRNVKLGKEFC